jgi:HK97 family phage prohead protease
MMSTRADHPPTDVHAGEHAPGDIEFLHNMAVALRGTAAMAQDHLSQTSHPGVMSLANQLASSHAAQLVRVDGLRARIGNATASTSTTTSAGAGSSGHGQGGGNAYGQSDGRAAASPYGDVSYADPGYQADKKKRYPLDTADHVKAAWSYINMAKNAAMYSAGQVADVKGRIKAAAKRFGIAIAGSSSNDSWEAYEELRSISPLVGQTLGVRWHWDGASEVREAVFEMEPSADGLTLEGYAAVFNTPTQIRDWEGDFEETIKPGAFQRTLAQRMPVLMFNHGKHPLIGDMPLGVIRHAEEDSKGLYVSARLTDNWLVQPVRDAIRDGGIRGMSFRFTVPQGGDTWSARNTKRAIHDLDSKELGPVVFPAYEPTTVSVRSALDCIDCTTGRPGARSAGGGDSDAQPGNGEASRIRAALRVIDVNPLLSKEHYRV